MLLNIIIHPNLFLRVKLLNIYLLSYIAIVNADIIVIKTKVSFTRIVKIIFFDFAGLNTAIYVMYVILVIKNNEICKKGKS